jgi:chemotaxis protein CheX
MIDHSTIVNSICAATQEVFSTMLGMDVTPGEPHIDKNRRGAVDGVVALIGLAGSWIGTGSISCSAGFACDISGSLLMAEYQKVDEEVLDAVAEVTNMIIGNFKTLMEELLGPMGMSIPTVVYGRNFSTRSIGTDEWVVVPFRCGGQEMEVRVCLAPARTPQHARPGFLHVAPVSD